MRLLLTILHDTFSGFFCDVGVKNEATDDSIFGNKVVREYIYRNRYWYVGLVSLVAVGSTLRLRGGGDTAPARELDLFIPNTVESGGK
jgi:hypothetical protein